MAPPRRGRHNGGADRMSRLWASLKRALLSTLFVLQKDHSETPPAVSGLSLALKTAQLMCFVFSQGGSALMVPLAAVTGATTIEWYFRWMRE